MKFTALLIAAAVAQDCSADATACTADQCCGTATPSDADAGTVTTTCADATATEWSDAEGNQYTFACNPAADGANKLVLGAAIAAAALYM